MPPIAVVEKLAPRKAESAESKLDVAATDGLDKNTMAPESPDKPSKPPRLRPGDALDLAVATGNRVEVQPRSVHSMSGAELESVLGRYKLEFQQGKTQIEFRLGGGMQARDLASSYIIANSSNQRLAFDRNGRRDQLNGSLQAAIGLSDLPFPFRETLIRDFGLDSPKDYQAYVVVAQEVEISMYRSLYEHLRTQGRESPRTDWVYKAELSQVPKLTFRWTERSARTPMTSIGR